MRKSNEKAKEGPRSGLLADSPFAFQIGFRSDQDDRNRSFFSVEIFSFFGKYPGFPSRLLALFIHFDTYVTPKVTPQKYSSIHPFNSNNIGSKIDRINSHSLSHTLSFTHTRHRHRHTPPTPYPLHGRSYRETQVTPRKSRWS